VGSGDVYKRQVDEEEKEILKEGERYEKAVDDKTYRTFLFIGDRNILEVIIHNK